MGIDHSNPRYVKAGWFAPDFDFDKDGCLPDAGISRGGRQNGGLKPTGKWVRPSLFCDDPDAGHVRTGIVCRS
ncbi:NPP1 family protein [Vibrio quintilis]|uniref:NPP1 family protein n=1 Tax=Vibrio quintilis TaxID=1117707 RepID=UPI0009363A69|nr:NPP1 family protein [Vibrio quintilis]